MEQETLLCVDEEENIGHILTGDLDTIGKLDECVRLYPNDIRYVRTNEQPYSKVYEVDADLMFDIMKMKGRNI